MTLQQWGERSKGFGLIPCIFKLRQLHHRVFQRKGIVVPSSLA